MGNCSCKTCQSWDEAIDAMLDKFRAGTTSEPDTRAGLMRMGFSAGEAREMIHESSQAEQSVTEKSLTP